MDETKQIRTWTSGLAQMSQAWESVITEAQHRQRQREGSAVEAWVSAFTHISNEWHQTVSVAEERRRDRERKVVDGWRKAVGEMFALQARLQRRGLWYHGRPDLLGVIGRGRREIYHSQMLAWLLDPGTPSGLGERFLKEFLSYLDPELGAIRPAELYQVQVSTEATGDEARTDILLRAETFTVPIEVKVDAGEGKDQCDRIYRDYESAPDPRFVFLTPMGRSPDTATGEARDHFLTVSFREVRELLARVLRTEQLKLPYQDLSSPLTLQDGGLATCWSYLSSLNREFS